MEQFIKTVESINGTINSFVWGPIMLTLLVGVGIYLTIRVGFFQFVKFPMIMRETIIKIFKKSESESDQPKKTGAGNITPFQAMTTAIASTVGVGNIAGVATAIVAGGPGAIFWMWISALFGMMTKYGEILLAIKFRETDENGIYHGGPMYYIEKGLKQKWLAIVFAIFATFASFGIGNLTQSHEIAVAVEKTFGLDRGITGLIIAAVVAMVILGGIGRIAKVTEKVVPFMAVFYIIGGIVTLCINAPEIPAAFALIFTEAFSFESVGGGVMGYVIARAIRFGFARGVFSNEAGLGSAPIAHASANTNNPVKQGMWGVFEVFVDTIVICTITALVIITSGLAGVAKNADGSFVDGGALTSLAYEQALGSVGGMFVSIAIIFFALSTILGWSHYGQQCIAYLTKNSKGATLIFRCIFISFVCLGALGQLELLWAISDTLNGLMAIPNLIAIVCLSGIIIKTTKDYLKDPDSVKIKD